MIDSEEKHTLEYQNLTAKVGPDPTRDISTRLFVIGFFWSMKAGRLG